MYPKIITLISLILPLPLLATPCNQATQLVIQAYELTAAQTKIWTPKSLLV